MAILITGGCGYIGSHTAIEMTKAGYEIVILDNFYNSKPEGPSRLRACGKRNRISAIYATPRDFAGYFRKLDRSGNHLPTRGRESVSSPRVL